MAYRPYGIKYPTKWHNGDLKSYVRGYWRRVFWDRHTRPYVLIQGFKFYIN